MLSNQYFSQMNSRITIAVYKPKEGKEAALHDLVLTHYKRLSDEKLVTQRQPIICQAKDKTILEIFEWQSEEAIHAAHSNPVVLAMWKEFGEVCTYLPVAEVNESKNMFSDFSPIN